MWGKDRNLHVICCQEPTQAATQVRIDNDRDRSAF
jgi:hypothetical protein